MNILIKCKPICFKKTNRLVINTRKGFKKNNDLKLGKNRNNVLSLPQYEYNKRNMASTKERFNLRITAEVRY